MSTQKKKIAFLLVKTLVTLVLVTLLLDLFFTKIVLRSLDDSSNFKKIERLLSSSQEEIPIFGSSIARRNYFPDSIGFNTYNYGMAGALFHTIEPLIKIELEKDKSSPIILDFDQHTFFYEKNAPVQISNYIPHIGNEHIETMLQEYGYFKKHYKIIGMRYYSTYTDYIRDYFKPIFEKEETINKGGNFYPVSPQTFNLLLNKRLNMISKREELLLKSSDNSEYMTRADKFKLRKLKVLLEYEGNESQIERFKNLVKTHPNRRFILVYSPQHWSKLKGLPNYNEVISLLNQLNEIENIEVLDYSDQKLPDSYYHDSGHMNIEGAKNFSRLLRTDLSQILN